MSAALGSGGDQAVDARVAVVAGHAREPVPEPKALAPLLGGLDGLGMPGVLGWRLRWARWAAQARHWRGPGPVDSGQPRLALVRSSASDRCVPASP